MPRYHVSQDGVSRVCKAATADSCTAVGVDGESAPHGEFSSADEARRFAESVLEKSSLGDGLDGISREKDAVAMVGEFPEMQDPAPEKRPVKPAYLAESLRNSLVEYQSPHRTEAHKREIEEYWNSNGISSPEDAQARATEIQAQVDRDHSNRIAAIGQDREADAQRFAETSEELAKMDAALDLGSRMQPDYRQILQENKELGRVLRRETAHDAEMRELKELRQTGPLPDLKNILTDRPRNSIAMNREYSKLKGVQRDLDEGRISNYEARQRIAQTVKNLRGYEQADPRRSGRPESVAYTDMLESFTAGVEPEKS